MTVLASASWVASSACCALVSGSCATGPRPPCSSDSTAAALFTAALPPVPAPTSPGDTAVGAASSHGLLAAAVCALTAVVAVVFAVLGAGAAEPLELEPQPATASARATSPTPPMTT